MFRKLISNVNYSPALVGQLGFYAKRLRREEATRRLGLVFTALALVVQSLAVFQPPEAANAASSADFVRGGVSNVRDFLGHYDRNTNNIKKIYNSLGITRAEIASAKPTVIGEASRYNWSMTSLYSRAQGQRAWDYGPGTVYYRPMHLTQTGGDRHEVFYAHSKTQGWFAIKKDCGNLITAHPPVKPPVPPKPTPPKPPTPTPPKPTPVATCTKLNATIVNRTTVELNGQASVSGGATISNYTFVVKNASGAVVKTITVQSTSTTAAAESFELATPGAYTAELTVNTSVGAKTGAQCTKPFQIVKKEVCPYNPTLPPNSPDCQPCPGNPEIWIKDEKCDAEIINSKSATNLSQGNIVASTTTARAGDKIQYVLTAENTGLAPETVTMTEALDDVLEYATLLDPAGGSFDQNTKVLTWPAVQIKPGEKQSRALVVQMMTPLPSTNTGTSNEDSFDCKMVNTFGNAVEVGVECATEKVVVEQVVEQLPQTDHART